MNSFSNGIYSLANSTLNFNPKLILKFFVAIIFFTTVNHSYLKSQNFLDIEISNATDCNCSNSVSILGSYQTILPLPTDLKITFDKWDNETQDWVEDYKVIQQPKPVGLKMSVNQVVDDICPGLYKLNVVFAQRVGQNKFIWTKFKNLEDNVDFLLDIKPNTSGFTGEWVEIRNTDCRENGFLSFDYSGGLPPYQVVWFKNGIEFFTGENSKAPQSNLGAGVYRVLISDANGCSINLEQEIKLEDNSIPNPIFEIIQPDCKEKTLGSICIIDWDEDISEKLLNWRLYPKNGLNSAPFANLDCFEIISSGIYTLEMYDPISLCTKLVDVEVGGFEFVDVEMRIRSFSQDGICRTEFIAVPSGTPPFLFDWGNGFDNIDRIVVDKFPSDVVVRVRDANGCEGGEEISVSFCGVRQNQISVSPTPNNGIFNIRFKSSRDVNQLIAKIYDIGGTNINSINLGSITSGTHILPINSGITTSGSYTLIIESDGNVLHEVVQIVIQP